MKSLAFDSISKSLSISLIVDENIYEVNKLDLEHSNNTYLIPLLEELLNKHDAKITDVDFISMGIGPGSFTALRISFSTIKALAYACNLPIIGIPSLDALYKNIEHYNGIKATFIAARKGSVYAKIYFDKACILDTLDITYDDAISFIKKYMNYNAIKEDTEIILCGDGYVSAKDIFDEQLNVVEIDLENNIIKSKNIHALALQRYEKQDFDNIFTLSPLYIRRAEAEILYEKLNQK